MGENFSSPGSGSVLAIGIRIRIQEILLNTDQDPDPGCQIYTDPHGSGSETIALIINLLPPSPTVEIPV